MGLFRLWMELGPEDINIPSLIERLKNDEDGINLSYEPELRGGIYSHVYL